MSSFQARGTKLERVWPKNQHTRSKLKLLNFENWCQKVPKFDFQSQFSMSKIFPILYPPALLENSTTRITIVLRVHINNAIFPMSHIIMTRFNCTIKLWLMIYYPNFRFGLADLSWPAQCWTPVISRFQWRSPNVNGRVWHS